MKITFYGGARSVTGANYMLTLQNFAGQNLGGRDTGSTKFLIDCGLNQGTKYAEDLNYQNFKFKPEEIKYVFITHSHIDHIGRLPKLYKDGFRGKVFATTATKDLMEIALPDNMRQIQEEAKNAGHEPLFKQEDLEGLMSLAEGVNYGEPLKLDGITVIFHDAGHILGSAIIEVRWQENNVQKSIWFSGDLGNPPTPLLRPTENIAGADYVVIESAYGDRTHEPRSESKNKLRARIIDVIKGGGVLMIPSFAIERTQELLFDLNDLFNEKLIPKVPVFIDSPLAIKMTAVYKKHPEYFNKEVKYLINSGDDVFNFPDLKMAATTEQSKAINDIPPPKIIIAGSGMSQGGRILHHELRYLSDPKNTILFVGYQADGSLGRKIQKGDKEVRILGQSVAVNCGVESISSYSAHADQRGLLAWVNTSQPKPKRVFVVQGEEEAARTLANLIHDELRIEAEAPVEDESVELA